MYSYSDRLRAVELYIQYGRSAATTVRVLGYPSKKQLRRWYRSYSALEELPLRKPREPKYSTTERRQAVEHYFRTVQCIARTVREFGYPSREWLRAWVTGKTPVAATRRPNEAPARARITLIYIQPGKPTQSAYIEPFNQTVRHEWLDLYSFVSLDHAQDLATQWCWQYNNERPNTASGGVPPMQLMMAA